MQTILEPQSLGSASPQELMREVLARLGEDPERDGLRHVEITLGRNLLRAELKRDHLCVSTFALRRWALRTLMEFEQNAFNP